MTSRDLLTPQDEAYIAAQARNFKLAERFLPPARFSVPHPFDLLLCETKALRHKAQASGQIEAAECLATACAAIEDAKEALS